jgi:hypothetical protein
MSTATPIFRCSCCCTVSHYTPFLDDIFNVHPWSLLALQALSSAQCPAKVPSCTCSGSIYSVAAAAVARLLFGAAVQCAVCSSIGLLPLSQFPGVQRNAISGPHRGTVAKQVGATWMLFSLCRRTCAQPAMCAACDADIQAVDLTCRCSCGRLRSLFWRPLVASWCSSTQQDSCWGCTSSSDFICFCTVIPGMFERVCGSSWLVMQ